MNTIINEVLYFNCIVIAMIPSRATGTPGPRIARKLHFWTAKQPLWWETANLHGACNSNVQQPQGGATARAI